MQESIVVFSLFFFKMGSLSSVAVETVSKSYYKCSVKNKYLIAQFIYSVAFCDKKSDFYMKWLNCGISLLFVFIAL